MQKICDYSDTDYKKDFWGDGKRDYEDLAERYAIRKLMPATGKKFLEIGGGFGRLLNEYAPRFTAATLIDYAPNLVAQAEEKITELNLTNVDVRQGNIYDLSPLGKGYDCGLMVRVMHHLENVPAAFTQINKVLNKNGTFILEYANKRNLLEILRFLLKRPNIKPFAYQPTARGEGLFYNFHPDYIQDTLLKCGFIIEKRLAVSLFRNALLKKYISQTKLAFFDSLLQKPLGLFQITPSVFLKIKKIKDI